MPCLCYSPQLSFILPIDHISWIFTPDTPSIAIPISMAKTSGAHPLSSPENTTMVTRTRLAKRCTPSAKYLAVYGAATPPPSSQKTKTKKKGYSWWSFRGRHSCSSWSLQKDKYMSMMHAKHAQYLNNLEDAEQYPAARCSQGHGIYMYHRSMSAAVESMNAANCEMRAKTAVDPLNACILLMKLKCKRFSK